MANFVRLQKKHNNINSFHSAKYTTSLIYHDYLVDSFQGFTEELLSTLGKHQLIWSTSPANLTRQAKEPLEFLRLWPAHDMRHIGREDEGCTLALKAKLLLEVSEEVS